MVLLLCSSCSYEELSHPVSSEDRILAVINTPPVTRTAMGDAEDGANAVGILWTSDDQIGVFDASGASQKCYVKTDDSGNKADAAFAVSGTDAFANPVFAYYPYNSANDGKSISSLSGNLPHEQNMDSGKLYGDYKYGISTGSTEQGHQFVFSHLFSMARIQIDATSTPLAGQKLKSLSVSVKRGSEGVDIAGDFIFNATNGEWKTDGNLHDTFVLNWNDGPVLTSEPFTCYASLFPNVKTGDVFTIEVATAEYRAVFTATSKVVFYREQIYNFPVTPSKFESLKVYDANGNEVDYESLLPTIDSFGFNVSQNSGKLLNNQLVWNSSKHTPSFSSVSSHTADIDNDTEQITLTIPYLYDFKLKPSFSTSNDNCVVTVNGEEQISGETEVDFTKPVTYTVTNTVSGYSRDYVVTVTNTGLPIVVITQSKSAEFTEVTKTIRTGFLSWETITVNEFVDFMIRDKESSWASDDLITVYNADGTIDCDVTGGVRLRGNTTQDYPKKPFAIKFNEKKSVLGMPKHKRWVLLANWLDHSMIRNTVAFDIAQAVEYAWRQSGGAIGDGIPWSVHGQNVELVFFDSKGIGHHVGNYYLCEQIKIDENRLNIRDSYEDVLSTNMADCGYLLEFDMKEDNDTKYTTSNGAWVKFKDDKIAESSLYSAVCEKIQGIEDNLDAGNYTAAYNDLDINSLVDQFLIWELTMNREYGDPGSVYMFMDGDGKLCAGPVWDFDRGTFQNQEKATSLGNSTSYRVKPDNAWMFLRSQESEDYSYIWYRQLMKDATFQQTVQQRWAVIKPYLDLIPDQIRSYGEKLALSYEYDSAMWPTNKSDITKYKYDFKDWSGDEQIASWDEVVDNFVTVYKERLDGMNTLITTGKFTN